MTMPALRSPNLSTIAQGTSIYILKAVATAGIEMAVELDKVLISSGRVVYYMYV